MPTVVGASSPFRDSALHAMPLGKASESPSAAALNSAAQKTLSVAIVGINYAPETTGIAPYTTGLAAGLAARGHNVQVFTGQPHYPQWERLSGYAHLRSTEDAAGVRLRRFRHFVPRRQSAKSRALMELTFGLQVVTAGWRRPDVVVCISPPLLASALCAARSRLSARGPAVGVLVHDVYSRALVEMGAQASSPTRAVGAVESFVTRAADGVAVIHEGFADDLITKFGVAHDRVREIRNWSHVTAPTPRESAAFRREQGWRDDELVVLHAGNMGSKQGLENVIAAARLGASRGARVKFVLLGDGHQRRHLHDIAADVPELQFIAPVSDARFPAALGAADVLLVNELPGVAQMAMPSKLTSYFVVGKPILAAADDHGFTAREIAASGAGIHVPAGRPDLLLNEAVRLGSDRQLMYRLGAAGRRYSEANLSAVAALDRYETWIRDLAANRHRQAVVQGDT
ncbi:glycosyltransferase family 4 protein [Aldersonia sp. NBC_00410]|uniref:glycosyltransferase family 4 protein n=1 Tax=Aldersonia sp. NBC_00410 TaxID=2975954 RepID=UPI00224D0B8E|nr:glycosyltransferase family 4 protein [Aldersonia sp. NBC_00410]MCX5041683.1 glycosyltransferase family 4 protein [Aldersonia sp. NBC_00410]